MSNGAAALGAERVLGGSADGPVTTNAEKPATRPSAGEIKPNGKRKQLYLGLFTDPVDAAKAYDREAMVRFGEFGCLNFPDGWHGPAEPPAVAADFTFLQADLGGVAP